jgi:hypothetical protein
VPTRKTCTSTYPLGSSDLGMRRALNWVERGWDMAAEGSECPLSGCQNERVNRRLGFRTNSHRAGELSNVPCEIFSQYSIVMMIITKDYEWMMATSVTGVNEVSVWCLPSCVSGTRGTWISRPSGNTSLRMYRYIGALY